MGRKMTIRNMSAADIDKVVGLDNRAFSKPWNEQSFKDEICKDYAYYFVAQTDNKIIGYIGIWCIYETAELIRVAVLPEFQGQGIAGGLIQMATDCAKSNGCERMILEVRDTNIAARRLYERVGFKKISIRRGYYDGEDAIIMERIY